MSSGSVSWMGVAVVAIALINCNSSGLYAQGASASASPSPESSPAGSPSPNPSPIPSPAETPAPAVTGTTAADALPEAPLAQPSPSVSGTTASAAKPSPSVVDQSPNLGAVRLKVADIKARIARERIGLVDAVGITLLQQPAIQLQKDTTLLDKANILIESGQFDFDVRGDLTLRHHQEEITKSQIAAQQQERLRAKKLIQASRVTEEKLKNDITTIVKTGVIPPGDPTNTSDLATFQNAVQQAVINGFLTLPGEAPIFAALKSQEQQLILKNDRSIYKTLVNTEGGAEKQLRQLGGVNSVDRADSINYDLGITKTFRNGVSITVPSITYTQAGDSLNRRTGVRPIDRGEIGFSVNVPLGRGAGVTAADAGERSAILNYEASLLQLQHTASQSVLTTVLAYWNCVAAQEQLAIDVRAEETAGTILSLSQSLADADSIAPADLAQIRARLMQARTARIADEGTVIQAKQNLGLAMGLTTHQITSAPLAGDPFPSPYDEGTVAKLPKDPFVDYALQTRADLQSFHKLEKSGRILVEAARVNLRPLINVSFGASYAGLDEASGITTMFSPYTGGLAGPSVFGTLSMDWPIMNHAQRGNYLEAQAAFQEQVINTEDVSRQIASNVVLNLDLVKVAIRQLNEAEQESKQYEAALANEREKLKAGESTILDTVISEQNFTGALGDVVRARLAYAMAVAQFRFETATIMARKGTENHVTSATLTTLPLSITGR